MPPRHAIKDADWERIKHLLPGQRGQHGKVAKNNRRFIDAVLWIAKTGAPWRDLPEYFGNWNSVWRRFDRWAKKGVWRRVFEVLQDPDLEWVILDSTAIRAHPHAAGAKKKRTVARAKPIRPWGGAEAGSRPRSTVPSAGSGFPPRSS
jgi:transposase